MSVSCGALDVGEICTTWLGIVTDCAIGIVALEAISPMITLAWFTLMSFVAASTDAAAAVWPSSEPTSLTWIFFASPVCFRAAFCRPMPTLTARSRFAPYAASPPVNGRTSPIRSVNAQFLDCCAVRVVPADPTDVASAAVATTITTAASAVTPLFLTIPPLLRSTEWHHYAPPRDRDAPVRHPRHRRAD